MSSTSKRGTKVSECPSGLPEKIAYAAVLSVLARAIVRVALRKCQGIPLSVEGDRAEGAVP